MSAQLRHAVEVGCHLLAMASHGRIYSRTQRGKLSYYIDFGKLGRVYAMPSPDGGQPLTIRDAATAKAIQDSINAAVARQKISLEKALAPWIRKLEQRSRFGPLYDKWLERMRERVARFHRLDERGADARRPLHAGIVRRVWSDDGEPPW